MPALGVSGDSLGTGRLQWECREVLTCFRLRMASSPVCEGCTVTAATINFYNALFLVLYYLPPCTLCFFIGNIALAGIE